jgi:ABC-type transporter Mla subunit MlaD
MKQYIITLFIVIGLVSSCSNNEKTLYLKADNVNGLTNKADVTINGFVIGQVKKINLQKSGQLIIELDLNKESEIPSDSRFKIEHSDMFGAKGISISLGQSNTYISVNDTITVTNEETLLQSDSLKTKAQDFFENLTGSKQRDSILIELRRLNKNLEELKHDR